MNQKIKSTNNLNTQQGSEFTSDFIRVLVALTGATLLIVFAFEHRSFTISWNQRSAQITTESPYGRMYLYPWMVAGGHTIVNGISEFSGKSPSLISLTERLAALLGLLFGFVIGPTLFFFGWYNRRKDRESGSKVSVLKGSAVISVIGAILVFAVAIPSIPRSIKMRKTSINQRYSQALQSNKDQIINNLNMIGYNARQYRILPKSLDGGNGSYVGYVLPKEFASSEEGMFVANSTSDDMTLKGVSNKYPGSSVTVHLTPNVIFLHHWEYSGYFE